MTKQRITYTAPTASGRRKGWAKVAVGVNRAGKGGHAVLGEFLPEGVQTEVEPGSIIVECRPAGSVKHAYKEYVIGRVGHNQIFWWMDTLATLENFLDFLDRLEPLLERADKKDNVETIPGHLDHLQKEIRRYRDAPTEANAQDLSDACHAVITFFQENGVAE